MFTGTLIVVPDSSALARVGEATVGAKPPGRRGAEGPDAGVTGLKKLGVKELTYRSGNKKTQNTFGGVGFGRPCPLAVHTLSGWRPL